MDLISQAQHTDIRGALQNVFDTFCDTDVQFYVLKSSVSESMEDFGTELEEIISVKAFVEYPKSKTVETADRNYEDSDVVLMIGLDDLEASGLLNSENLPKIRPEDNFSVNGIKYRVINARVDGAFQSKNIVVMITGNIAKNV